MEPPEGWDPYRRPARRTLGPLSALTCHYGLERGLENGIVVLAAGLEQELQEIFQRPACAGAGRIPGEELRTLCRALALQEAAEPERCAGLWDGLSAELTSRRFHARLCGPWSTRAGPRLPLGRESERTESQIRPRSPRRRRRRARPAEPEPEPEPERRPPGPRSREPCEEMAALERAEERIAELHGEKGSLRELLQDTRAALQSSDARGRALQLSPGRLLHRAPGAARAGPSASGEMLLQESRCLEPHPPPD